VSLIVKLIINVKRVFNMGICNCWNPAHNCKECRSYHTLNDCKICPTCHKNILTHSMQHMTIYTTLGLICQESNCELNHKCYKVG
jgi:hypothetical protein